MNEPFVKRSFCSYCGDAPVNHFLYFLDSFISDTLDSQAIKIIKYVPGFIKNFADLIPRYLFETLAFLKLVKFSSDINKARTFRSKVIWEEAERRGIKMKQVVFRGKPLDYYRAMLNGKNFYFESIPVRPELGEMSKNWDDKIVLKQEFRKYNIPTPLCLKLSPWSLKDRDEIFSKITKPIIVKPRIGSRGRHTITNINTLEQFHKGINIAGQICFNLIIEEHLKGSVCRLSWAGFWRGFIRDRLQLSWVMEEKP